MTETRWADSVRELGEGQTPHRDDNAAAGLMQMVQKIVSEIEAFKWERVAEPAWAARVEVASVYFRKRQTAAVAMPRAA